MVPMAGLLRGGQLRSPLGLSLAFASEQTIDELAHAVKMDPVEFRRKNIGDKRWLAVLDTVANAAGWKPRVANSARQDGDIATGRGVAIGTHNVSFGAAVAEVEVNKRTGEIVAKHLYGALDAGLVVNPAVVEAQIIGQLTQSTSRVLKEEVLFNKNGVTSLDWASYPILRFAEHPKVTAIVVQRVDEPSTGAGEELTGAAAAAIANAVFDAIGVRLRKYPMTAPRVLAALAASRT
jgi:CO/xanthine dehydrogenase Mo-binding subunit